MEYTYLSGSRVAELIPPLQVDDHKGTRGHALFIGGSKGKIGSIRFAAEAALRTGCGLVTVCIPACGYTVLQTAFPEAMVITDMHDQFITHIEANGYFSGVGVGPGLGTQRETSIALDNYLTTVSQPLVLDADALNILSLDKTLWAKIPRNSIVTPHKKEFERLNTPGGSDVLSAVDFAFEKQVVVVLKGAPTVITDGKAIYYNTTGNPALATAGSGDVLTGIITGFIAQGLLPMHAALVGVYLHGLCADLALNQLSARAFIATDILKYLGVALQSIGR